MASCSRTPIPTASRERTRQTCWQWMFVISRRSRSAVFQVSVPSFSSPCQRPVAHSGWKIPDALHLEIEPQRLVEELLGAAVGVGERERRLLHAAGAGAPPELVRRL